MRAELRTLFWLQWRLTLSMFRGRRTRIQLRALSFIGRLLMLLFTLPMFILMGIGLAVLLIVLSAEAAFEMVMMVNLFMFFIWLLLPSSYNSQLVERFQMSQLFAYPISFKGLVVGSSMMSFLTMTGLWTIPILIGEMVGLAWHQPLALPLMLLGSLPLFSLLVLTGRIMDDVFDLVSNDRRLRSVAVALLTLPFMLCGFSQFFLQQMTNNYEDLPDWMPQAIVRELEAEFGGQDEISGPEEAFAGISRAIEIVRVSRILIWLPPGWATAGMALAVKGQWGPALLFLLLSGALVALLLRLHASITRRLMTGAGVSIGDEKVRQRRRFQNLPGPAVFWGLFEKDWTHLWRSPVVRQMVFPSLVLVAVAAFVLNSLTPSDFSQNMSEALPLLAAAITIMMLNMVTNLSLTANYFGAIDREGFATLASSPVDRRYVLMSANLSTLLVVVLQTSIVSIVIALVTRFWLVLPMGLYLGICTQIGSSPAYNLAAVLVPYRTQLQFGNNNRQGNIWGMLAWLVGTPPVLAMIVLPYIFWKPGLIIALPLGVVYSVGVYALSSRPLAKLLLKREHAILDAVTSED